MLTKKLGYSLGKDCLVIENQFTLYKLAFLLLQNLHHGTINIGEVLLMEKEIYFIILLIQIYGELFLVIFFFSIVKCCNTLVLKFDLVWNMVSRTISTPIMFIFLLNSIQQ